MPTRLTEAEARALGIGGRAGASGPRSRRAVRRGPAPQQVLTAAALHAFPDGQAEYVCIPGRRFRLDLAWPHAQPPVAVELDGWQYHGKHKRDFHRDREKRNLLALNGWLVLAIPARDVHQRLDDVLAMIADALCRPRPGGRGLSGPVLSEAVRPKYEGQRARDARVRRGVRSERSADRCERSDSSRCGAHCRSTGQPCRMRALANGRCRLHGGLSTGPKTASGRARALANLRQFHLVAPARTKVSAI